MSVTTTESPAVLASPLQLARPPQETLRWLKETGGRLALAATGLILPLLLLGLWQYAVEHQWLAVQILPPPQLVWESLRDLWQSGDLQSNIQISLSRIGWSSLIGISAGVLLGLALGVSRTFRAYVYPTFHVVSQFPVVGWIPLLIIFLGIGEALKIAAITLAVVVPVTVQTYKGIANIPRVLLEVARVYRYSFAQVIWRVVLPAALPALFSGVRQGVMQAWLSLVFVELLASSEGIGYLMVWGRQLLQLDLVVVGIIIIGLVGVVLDLALRWLEGRLQGWRRAAF
ncbi:sulfonate transport system permease protein [Andreprevotia lacus DSM 23236]|jgi:sulfonate transport system permease protein|uniref:Sulfonate transport system permease protein n=1 Tax=Andreprevotia lacus DSM 23236 TaxID=1121001 RepID=A0A1W1Y2H6_9NEIS|nr:ABC transporter permease [Andreprevotia lacus]SMC29938.1 sulfonate transport system permease protein [Andreprevotia lacus DSM 23236]